MTTNNIRSLTRMGRRRFMRTASNLGISAGALYYLSQDALAENLSDTDDQVLRLDSIVHAEGTTRQPDQPPEREPQYYTIPRDAWVEVESAHDARRQIEQEVEAIKPSVPVQAMVETITSGQRQKKAVKVYVAPVLDPDKGKVDVSAVVETLREALPSKVTGIAGRGTDSATSVQGIPIIIEQKHQKLEEYYTDDYGSEVPAGCHHDTEPYETTTGDDIPAKHATLGPPAYDSDINSDVFLASGHVYTENGHRVECYQPRYNQYGYDHIADLNTNKIKNWESFDACVLVPDSGINPRWELASDAGGFQDGDIVGTLGRDKLVDEEGNTSYNIHHQGIVTGDAYGSVTGVSDTLLATDAAHDYGDSGGPHFETRFDGSTPRYLIAGVHRGGYVGGDPGSSGDAIATLMEEIEIRWNLAV